MRTVNEKYSFKQYLASSAEEIDDVLADLFKKWLAECETISPHLVPLMDSFALANNSGKRLRGTLIKLGYQLVNPHEEIPRELLTISCAYEIFQTAILAHDDIIDKSPTRRGKPTLTTSLGGDHYALSQTICLGDLGFFQAFRLLSETHFGDTIKNKAIAFFSKTLVHTGLGEMLDIALAQKRMETNEQEIYSIYRSKTAYYTVIAPLSLGAIVGGGDESLLHAIAVFGENLGIMYQLLDDIHDVFADPKSLKKEVGGDIKEGKNTLLFLYAWKNANAEQKKLLIQYYGNPTVTQENISQLQKIFIETGAYETSLGEAESYRKKAQIKIEDLTENKDFQYMLRELTEFFH